MTPRQTYDQLLAQKLIIEFEKRNFTGYFCESKEAALQKALEQLEPGCRVSHGGSETLHEIGLIDALKNGSYDYLDPLAGAPADMAKTARDALAADCFFMGSNAITLAGELVNVDGIGNRLAGLMFGPSHVVVIAGLNKVVANVDAALTRIKTRAAPLILLKFKRECPDFDSLLTTAADAYGQLAVTNHSPVKGRICIILVGEDLGY